MKPSSKGTMLIWGSATRTKIVCDIGECVCPICTSAQRFVMQVKYTFSHIYYFLCGISCRQYLVLCTRCGNGFKPADALVRNLTAKDPIPLIERKGWLIFGGPIVAIGLVASVLGIWEESRHAEDSKVWITKPKVGDVYLADLSKVTKSFDISPAYGAIKLVNLDAQTEVFEISKSAYRTKDGLSQYVSDHDTHGEYYYDQDDRLELPVGQVRRLFDTGVFYDVRR